ncbi:type III-B CRISPR module-associated protein Cmr5 [Nocardia sp. NPDC003482]
MPERELRRVDQLVAVHAARALAPLEITDTVASICSRLAPMIMRNGLAATGAYLLARANSTTSRDGTAYRRVAAALLTDAATHAAIPADPDTPHRTLDDIAATSGHQYLIAEARARVFASWLARLATAQAPKHTTTETAAAGEAEVRE